MRDDDFNFFRPIVFHLFLTGYEYPDAFLCLQNLYGQLIPELPTIKKWYAAIASDSFMFRRKRLGKKKLMGTLTKKLEKALKNHPKASTKYLADMLCVHRTTIKNRLIHDLGMRQYKLIWIPHSLSKAQKEKRMAGAAIIKEALHTHCSNGYRNLITGDESWFYYDNETDMMWLPRGSQIPTRAKKTISSPKIFLTVFFSGEKILHWSYLPRGETMKSSNFISTVLTPLLHVLGMDEKGEMEIGFFFFFCCFFSQFA
jgi:hypothetical protein